MRRRRDQIGFSQRVRLEWLERTANLVLAGNGKLAVNETLQELLKDKVSVGGQAERGNREKVISILQNTWLIVPGELEGLRNDGLELLRRMPQLDHLALHWGMVTAVYPFWSVVASYTGRLLRLQGSVATGHILRRVCEQYGERETVSRAARRVLNSFMDWGVIQKSGPKGNYLPGISLPVEDPQLVAWLTEAALHARANGAASLRELLESPDFFPFRIRPIHANNFKSASARIEILRHGLEDELVMLKKPMITGGAS